MDRLLFSEVTVNSSPGRFRSYLYVPGSNRRMVTKAFESAADAVVIDLEDAVAAHDKDSARATAAAVVAEIPPKPTFVRINDLSSGRAQEDVEAVVGPGLTGIRLPKVDTADAVVRVAGWLARAGSDARIVPLIESALGVELAFAIAGAHAMVTGLAMGEADLRADLGAAEAALGYARARCVVAARAAGLVEVVQSVYTRLGDLDGLRASTELGRATGFTGRSAIHPDQVPVINAVFTPSAAEQAAARAVLAALPAMAESGVAVTPSGRFVDPAVVRSARAVLDLARLAGSGTE